MDSEHHAAVIRAVLHGSRARAEVAQAAVDSDAGVGETL
jgi:hypothetical protein